MLGFLAIVALATGCGGGDGGLPGDTMSRKEFQGLGSSGLETRADVQERFGEGIDVSNLSGFTKGCLFYEKEDASVDGLSYQVCFTKDGEFDWGKSWSLIINERQLP